MPKPLGILLHIRNRNERLLLVNLGCCALDVQPGFKTTGLVHLTMTNWLELPSALSNDDIILGTRCWHRIPICFLRSFCGACACSSCGTWFSIALLQESQRRCPGLFRFLARCLCLAVLFRGCWFARRQRCSWLEKTSRRCQTQSYLPKARISACFSPSKCSMHLCA